MFYGLNKIIKNILPKSLFYRALLIVAVPVLVLQLVVTVVFFDSLWIKTTKGMTRALVNEISTLLEFYKNDRFVKTASSVQVRKKLYNTSVERWKNYEQQLTPLYKELKQAKIV